MITKERWQWKHCRNFLLVMDNPKKDEGAKMRLDLLLSLCMCVHPILCLSYMLFNVVQIPLPPSVYQRLTSSSTLLNLAQALAYHRMYDFIICSIILVCSVNLWHVNFLLLTLGPVNQIAYAICDI